MEGTRVILMGCEGWEAKVSKCPCGAARPCQLLLLSLSPPELGNSHNTHTRVMPAVPGVMLLPQAQLAAPPAPRRTRPTLAAPHTSCTTSCTTTSCITTSCTSCAPRHAARSQPGAYSAENAAAMVTQGMNGGEDANTESSPPPEEKRLTSDFRRVRVDVGRGPVRPQAGRGVRWDGERCVCHGLACWCAHNGHTHTSMCAYACVYYTIMRARAYASIMHASALAHPPACTRTCTKQ